MAATVRTSLVARFDALATGVLFVSGMIAAATFILVTWAVAGIVNDDTGPRFVPGSPHEGLPAEVVCEPIGLVVLDDDTVAPVCGQDWTPSSVDPVVP